MCRDRGNILEGREEGEGRDKSTKGKGKRKREKQAKKQMGICKTELIFGLNPSPDRYVFAEPSTVPVTLRWDSPARAVEPPCLRSYYSTIILSYHCLVKVVTELIPENTVWKTIPSGRSERPPERRPDAPLCDTDTKTVRREKSLSIQCVRSSASTKHTRSAEPRGGSLVGPATTVQYLVRCDTVLPLAHCTVYEARH